MTLNHYAIRGQLHSKEVVLKENLASGGKLMLKKKCVFFKELLGMKR